MVMLRLLILGLVLVAGCAFVESIMYEQPEEEEKKQPVVEQPKNIPPKGCLAPYEKKINNRCCIEYEGEYICDLDYEAYSICARKRGVDEKVIFYYTDWCMGCEDRLKLAKDHQSIYLADKEDETGNVVDNCFGNLVGIGLPKFICVRTGEVGINVDTAEDIEEFYLSCQR